MQLPKCSIRTIYYYITFACNLRCAHCYAGEYISPDSHAEEELVLRNLAQGYARGAREVVFLGGEPTLHPQFGEILTAAAVIGYSRIVVDTNGSALSPFTNDPKLDRALVVRVSFEGIDPFGHDTIRGQGVFQQALDSLRGARSRGFRTEATFTLHSRNCLAIEDIVNFFAVEKVDELNFHFVSLMGNGAEQPWLGLTAEMILNAQRDLERLQKTSSLRLRYPRLLVQEEEWENELAKGLACRMEQTQVLLILPRGQVCRCPLEISLGFRASARVDQPVYRGCPLFFRLLPGGTPQGYRATCISWK